MSTEINPEALFLAQQTVIAFERLPTLGPIAWLFGRDESKKNLTFADLDSMIMPPVILDQCRLFMRDKMPIAFFTWAYVSDEVHQRLLAGNSRVEPHEWKGGKNLWLIDAVTPFGQRKELLDELKLNVFQGQVINSGAGK